MSGKESSEKMRAAVLQLMRVDVMRSVNAKMMAATTTTTAMPAAGGRFARGCERRNRHDDDSKRGNGQPTSGGRGKALGHAVDWVRHGGRCQKRENEKTRPGECDRAGPVITICLHIRGGVADVDVALEPRAPHPAGRVAAVVEVAVVTVVAVAVVVMAVVVMAVMAVMAMVAVVTMMAVMAVMAVATTAVPAAGGRVSRGGEGRSRQSDSGNSSSEDRTLHGTSPGFLQSDHRPGVCPISALRSPPGM
jgi:hypothetical protein